MSAPRTVTLGCRLNTFESEVMRQLATDAGLDDTIIVNTCTVTGEAARQARQTIRRLRRDNPHSRIIVTGCAAQMNPEDFAAMEEVDRVLGNAEKLRPESFEAARQDDPDRRVAVADIMTADDTPPHLVDGLEGRTRAFVQVQQGCDHRCTFCIIPFARGPNRSIDSGTITDQVRHLVAQGHAEVVFTGVDICSWGADLAGQPTFGQLVRRVLRDVPGLRRLRLGSLDPNTIDDDLVRALAEEPRLMPHIHLSLQSADDMVLKRMKRRHSRAQAEDICRRLRAARPDVVFGADLIAGFPTETEAMFANTLQAVDTLGLVHLHVFPYSSRPGTPASNMPQVPTAVRKQRAQTLRARGERALSDYLNGQIGGRAAVLVETIRRGRSEHFTPVELDCPATPGAIIAADITGAGDDYLLGHLLGSVTS